MDKVKDPTVNVGDVVVIDKVDMIRFDVINYQDNYDVFKDNHNSDACYGLVTKRVERDSDDNYYIEGSLMNFSVEDKPVAMMEMRPYTSRSGPVNQIVYGSESGTSAFFSKLSAPKRRLIKAQYPHWFIT